jgi:hypothetical protein
LIVQGVLDGINLPPMDQRLQRRYEIMVQQHMKSSDRNAAGPLLLAVENQSAAATPAAWKFLHNPQAIFDGFS